MKEIFSAHQGCIYLQLKKKSNVIYSCDDKVEFWAGITVSH